MPWFRCSDRPRWRNRNSPRKHARQLSESRHQPLGTCSPRCKRSQDHRPPCKSPRRSGARRSNGQRTTASTGRRNRRQCDRSFSGKRRPRRRNHRGRPSRRRQFLHARMLPPRPRRRLNSRPPPLCPPLRLRPCWAAIYPRDHLQPLPRHPFQGLARRLWMSDSHCPRLLLVPNRRPQTGERCPRRRPIPSARRRKRRSDSCCEACAVDEGAVKLGDAGWPFSETGDKRRDTPGRFLLPCGTVHRSWPESSPSDRSWRQGVIASSVWSRLSIGPGREGSWWMLTPIVTGLCMCREKDG